MVSNAEMRIVETSTTASSQRVIYREASQNGYKWNRAVRYEACVASYRGRAWQGMAGRQMQGRCCVMKVIDNGQPS